MNWKNRKKLVQELSFDFDYIILDCPAGIEQGFKNAIHAANRAIVVTTPEVSAIRDSSLPGQAYMNICHRILGEEVEYIDFYNNNIFRRLSHIFKKAN